MISSYCEACEHWNKSKKEDTAEYEDWLEKHNCTTIHNGSDKKMGVESIIHMFKRLKNNYGFKYINYIVDGDSKTYIAIKNSARYETFIIKKECIQRVQKRMADRLRECKRKPKDSKKKVKKN